MLLTAIGTHRVSSTGILAYLLQIDHREHLAYHISLDSILLCPRHLVVVPHGDVHSLRRLHLAGEVVNHLATGQVAYAVASLYLLLGRQRAEILADECAQLSLVEVAHDGVAEGGRVCRSLLGYLQDAVVVYVF